MPYHGASHEREEMSSGRQGLRHYYQMRQRGEILQGPLFSDTVKWDNVI